MTKKAGLTLIFSLSLLCTEAQKSISLEDIWRDFTFYTKEVSEFAFRNDGQHYTLLENNTINEYKISNGAWSRSLLKGMEIQGQANFTGNISDYTFDAQEKKILLLSEAESINRRGIKGRFHVYDMVKKTVIPIFESGKIQYATFSPQGDKVAFVYEHNIYYKNLSNSAITQITFDGNRRTMVHGKADWIYEEEFGMTKAFEWSPDGSKLAYLSFDESQVKEVLLTFYNNNTYPSQASYKYPKAGSPNPKVRVSIYDIDKGKTIPVEPMDSVDHYVPYVKWLPSSDKLCFVKLNRLQNQLQILLYDVDKNMVNLLYEEISDTYIDKYNHLFFLENDNQFLWSSDKSGFHHIHLFNMDGTEVLDLTPGNQDISKIYGIDEKTKTIYYQATADSPADKHVFKVFLDGTQRTKISTLPGINEAQFSSTFTYYILKHHTINSPPSYTVYNTDNQLINVIEENSEITHAQLEYGVENIEFFTFKNSEGMALNGWYLAPHQPEKDTPHPLLMFVYGGPGSQEANNEWKGDHYWWFQLLAQKGYVVACVDNRGTGFRGASFQKSTYGQLGKYETLDQIEAAKFLASKSFIDGERIGIYGWSFGGYLATNALLKGNKVFKAGIAIAPVTNWKWYDSIYAERYLGSVVNNSEGYEDNSPVNYAHLLEGDYLIAHGMADDNVHFQHTVEMVEALIRANKQFDTYYYPNKNHGIYGDNSRLHLFTKMTNFILENL